MDRSCAGTQGPESGHLLHYELFPAAWARFHKLLPDVSSHGIVGRKMDAR